MSTIIRQQLCNIFQREYPQAKPIMHSVLLAIIVALSNVGVETTIAAPGDVAPQQVGNGFTVTAADLAYILKQIKIAEAHVAAGPGTATDPDNCKALVGTGPNQIPSPLLSYGLRTVDGACNNLQAAQVKYGAADEVFPRLTTPVFKPAEDSSIPGMPPMGPPGQTSYAQPNGVVVDSQPRVISNLIVDQTPNNPAAIYVAEHPARAQANPDKVFACKEHPGLLDCVPDNETLFIPNITTDVGLSPPFNSLFTIFGQFFDHGLDKITNGGSGAVAVPLKDGDPLIAGPDHILQDPNGTGCSVLPKTDPNWCDDLSADKRFMMLTRGTARPGPDGILGNADDIREAINTDTPFVDQSQTYSSHSSHQVFLREYKLVSGKPKTTGKFLSTTDGGMANWKMIKDQAANLLGLQLVDVDVNNIPMVLADQYGNFIPGPNGFAQFVTDSGLVEGNPAAPVAAPANVVRIETAFLNDIAHSAAPGSLTSPKTPQNDGVAGGSLDQLAPDVYDNELLDLHYICGDGRCNENIGLTAIHQIFHMEHDRLVDYFFNDNGSNIPTSFSGVLAQPENQALLADYQNVNLTVGPNKTFTFEERLFQAARFVTEMQYQHLVFEEFARKVQPAINPFQAFAFNQTDLNPAITAEFAHAVYRFGHSMLTETLPRINEDGSHNDIGLFEGFLNPAAYNDGGPVAGHLDDRKATASLIMGLSDQTGNEIDEFVTDVLRNRLVGLPLDLAAINMTRARSEGIPSLNNVRKQIFAATNDSQMVPYQNWVDFRENLKHSDDPKQSTLVNFIAAYGKHPLVLAAATLAEKRAAADLIVNGGVNAPADSSDFLFSMGIWANTGGNSITGVDDIDLWVGGLAEKTNLFGGLLGSTFNYVFEKQLTDLQNGDRFYYLARTPGMNLRSQLEGNSFSELVMRNTNSNTLKADPFATADCKFQLAHLDATAAGFLANGSTVADDPTTTECDESALLIRMPDGTIMYRSTNSVDPVGINGQSVFNGTDAVDRMFGGNDNDTFWGGLGNDIINGGGGDDFVLGGEGDDIILDFAGADFLKGGPGNDAIDGGIGDDIIIGADGKDFTNGGGNINETFSGPGDDFAIAGQGEDAVFGDSGDDWEEGGDQPDLLIGDSSSLFFDDHNIPGHDIMIGQGGDDDYDMEGGDDIGVSGPGVEKIAGGSGYDWEIGLGDPQAQDMDLSLQLVGVPLPINAVRDRYNEVEALSGWDLNDTLRGDSIIPSQVGGGGFIGCDALDADGVARIAGLETLVTSAMRNIDSSGMAAQASTNYCGLEGNVWGEGNILLGGKGSDTIEGRGADDIIDGDRYMNVRLSVRDGSGNELGSTDLMENKAITGDFGPGTAGMTLQQAVFAGLVNPGQIQAVREIITPTVPAPDCGTTNPVNCDTAVYSGVGPGPNLEYFFIDNGDGSISVIDNTVAVGGGGGARTSDGFDIIRNIEQLSFCDVPGAVRGTCDVARRVVKVEDLPMFQPVTSVTVTGTRDFGTVALNTSLPLVVTLKNTGTTPVVTSGMAITGVDAAAFTMTTAPATCPTPTIPIGGECQITVTFTPTTAGAKAAKLDIHHNAPGGISSVDLIGVGAGPAPIAAVSTTLVSFGFIATDIAQAPQRTVTLRNSGNADLVVTDATVTGNTAFSVVGDTCGTVAPNSICTVTVAFKPTAAGPVSATLNIAHNGAGAGTNIPLIGTGTGGTTGGTGGNGGVVTVPPAPSIVVAPAPATPAANNTALSLPTALNFGARKVNASHKKTVVVTNRQNTALPILFVSTSGKGFTASRGNCPTVLAAGKSCKIEVTFNPTAAKKNFTGILKLTSAASVNQLTMTLSGKGKR